MSTQKSAFTFLSKKIFFECFFEYFFEHFSETQTFMDGVPQQLGVHAGHPALDVELTHKPEPNQTNSEGQIMMETWIG